MYAYMYGYINAKMHVFRPSLPCPALPYPTLPYLVQSGGPQDGDAPGLDALKLVFFDQEDFLANDLLPPLQTDIGR
jgi:hypothetical protein